MEEGDMPRVCHLVVTVLGFALPWVAGAAAGAPAHTGAAKAPAGVYVSLTVVENEWDLQFLPANPGAVGEMRYRLTDSGDAAWHRADECNCGRLRALAPGRHRVGVEGGGKAGRTVKAGHTFSFDPDEEIVRLAKDYLARSHHWISFDDRPRYSWSLRFVQPATFRDALREVRWSLDGCTLDRRFPLGEPSPPGNYALPRAVGHDQKLDERVPVSARFVCVQLVFRDGATSEERRIYRDRPCRPPPEPAESAPANAAAKPARVAAGAPPPAARGGAPQPPKGGR